MGNVVIFGAGGQAGSAAAAEARRRGHAVTAVVRDPGQYAALGETGVALVAGDVTDADSVAAVAAGHDAAIVAVYDGAAPADEFFRRAGQSLDNGLTRAGVTRVVVVGLASILPTADGVPLMDTDGYPTAYRSFFLAHAGLLEVLGESALDWVAVSPAGDFGGERTGAYRVASADATSRVSYADLGIALLDEIDSPAHHRTHVGVES
ncbi:NAD(P)-dependent oxidoreductase [Nocardioides speluncae]|uniref:NAD(P)-dependent oxidoreductase n=1 Tax=Nocardioides speluncae TaxID=2670337 RepID=UPI000D69FC2A|nr:NAD(P)H-binding protein [Nocardioides speluncae]